MSLGKGNEIDAAFVAEPSAGSSLYFDQSWVSMLATIYPAPQSLISLMKSDDWTNLWVKRHEFRGQSDATPISKIIVVDSPLASVSSPAMCLWLDLQYQCASSCGSGLNSDQKAIGYPAPIALLPLLHPWTYLARSVFIAVHRAHGQIKLLLTTPSSLHNIFQYFER